MWVRLEGPMPPLNTYSQTIPKYSWSAASLECWVGHCEGCTFYVPMTRCLPSDGEVELRHRTQERTNCKAGLTYGVKSSKAKAFRESFMETGLEGFWPV